MGGTERWLISLASVMGSSMGRARDSGGRKNRVGGDSVCKYDVMAFTCKSLVNFHIAASVEFFVSIGVYKCPPLG